METPAAFSAASSSCRVFPGASDTRSDAPPGTAKTSTKAGIAPAAAAVLALTACGAPSENGADDTGAEDTLSVGATAVPAGEILEFIDRELAEDAGLSLEIHEYSDYIAPNTALDEGQLDQIVRVRFVPRHV